MVLPEQIEALIDFLESHRELALGHISRTQEGRQQSNMLWQQCAQILNSVSSDGARKTWSLWRSFYTDYKCRLVRRVRQDKQHQLGTGGGPNKKIVLSTQQERLLRILGEDVGDPLPGVRQSPPQLNEQQATAALEMQNSIESISILDIQSVQRFSASPQPCATVTLERGSEIVHIPEPGEPASSQPQRAEVHTTPVNRSRQGRRRRVRRTIPTGSPSVLASARQLFDEVGRHGAEATMELSRSNRQLALAITSSAERLAGALDRIADAMNRNNVTEQ